MALPLEDNKPWCPPVDVYRKNREYVILADLPGLDPDQIRVRTSGATLSIAGDRAFEPESNVEEHLRLERLHGQFVCEVHLPGILKGLSPRVDYREGVLEIRVLRA